jgi:hypothetical protein
MHETNVMEFHMSEIRPAMFLVYLSYTNVCHIVMTVFYRSFFIYC